MIDIVDLCDDDEHPQNASNLRNGQPSYNTHYSKPTAVQQTPPTQSETAQQEGRSLPIPGPCTSRSQTFSEALYIDFINTVEQGFPWQAFAKRHKVLENDLRHLLFVLVTLPLSDPDDNSKRLKVAQGAQKRFSEWRQAWEETVANMRSEASRDESDEKEKLLLEHIRVEGELDQCCKKGV